MIAMLRNLVFNDFWLKLFSLVLAILTWFTVSSALQQEGSSAAALRLGPFIPRTFSNIRLVVLCSAGEIPGCRVEPQAVEVTVQSDAKTMRNLQDSDIRAVVDLTGIQAAHDLKKRVEASAPPGVTILKVDPEQVQVIYPPRN